jgi:hypothetical protein
MATELNDTEIDTRIERKLRALGVIVRDEWHGAESAANHLKISKWPAPGSVDTRLS